VYLNILEQQHPLSLIPPIGGVSWVTKC